MPDADAAADPAVDPSVDPLRDALLRGGAPASSSRANSRAALVEAAFEEFRANGYEGTTVAAIAERAGVTTGAVYAHFSGKLDLFLATIGLTPVEDVERSIDELASLPPSATAELLGQQLRAQPSDRTLLLLDVIVVARRDRRIADALRTGLAGYMAATARAIDAGAASGAVEPALGADDLSRLFAVINLGVIVFAAMGAEPPTVDALTFIADLILRTSEPVDDHPEAFPLARVRARARDVERADESLRSAIVDAIDAGHSLRQVGAAAGLSHEQVRQVLRRVR